MKYDDERFGVERCEGGERVGGGDEAGSSWADDMVARGAGGSLESARWYLDQQWVVCEWCCACGVVLQLTVTSRKHVRR